MMVEAITFQTVFQFLQTISIMVGIAYYMMTLKNQNQSRQATLFMHLYSRYTDPNYLDRVVIAYRLEWKGLEAFLEQWKSNPDIRMGFTLIMSLFEGFGVLLMKGLIDGDLLYEQIPTNAYAMWDKYEPYIKWVRESENYPQYGRPWEYLAGEMRKIAISRGDPIYRESNAQARSPHIKPQ